MKTTHTKAALKRIVTTILALGIALSLSVPAEAKDIELEPDGFTTTTAPAVSSTAPASHGESSTVSAQEQVTTVAQGSADDGDRRSPRSSQSLTLSSLVDWLWSLPFFGG